MAGEHPTIKERRYGNVSATQRPHPRPQHCNPPAQLERRAGAQQGRRHRCQRERMTRSQAEAWAGTVQTPRRRVWQHPSLPTPSSSASRARPAAQQGVRTRPQNTAPASRARSANAHGTPRRCTCGPSQRGRAQLPPKSGAKGAPPRRMGGSANRKTQQPVTCTTELLPDAHSPHTGRTTKRGTSSTLAMATPQPTCATPRCHGERRHPKPMPTRERRPQVQRGHPAPTTHAHARTTTETPQP